MSHLGGLQWIVLEDFGHRLVPVCVEGVSTVTWEISTVKYSILLYSPLILSGNCILLSHMACFPLFYGSCAMSPHVAY